jgi:hypothetical protein
MFLTTAVFACLAVCMHVYVRVHVKLSPIAFLAYELAGLAAQHAAAAGGAPPAPDPASDPASVPPSAPDASESPNNPNNPAGSSKRSKRRGKGAGKDALAAGRIGTPGPEQAPSTLSAQPAARPGLVSRELCNTLSGLLGLAVPGSRRQSHSLNTCVRALTHARKNLIRVIRVISLTFIPSPPPFHTHTQFAHVQDVLVHLALDCTCVRVD